MTKIIKENIELAKHTSFKVGGKARYFAEPKNIEEFLFCKKFAKEHNISEFLLGKGSNLIIKDSGIDALCIKTTKMNEISLCGDYIEAYAGANLAKIGAVALENGLSGFEEIVGIPGTLGGAIVMNAGAYGAEISDILISSTYMDKDGNLIEIDKKSHEFSYRHSFYVDNPDFIIIKAKMKLRPSDKQAIKDRMAELRDARMSKQPLEYPSAGSTFKRPEGYFAGKLVEDAGLKGFSIGGAKVSEKHAGFVINYNNATAKDILDLIEYIKKDVYDKFNVNLECEVKIIGD